MAASSPTPRLLKDFLRDQTTTTTTDNRKTRFHKATEVFINAVKFLPFKSFKSPSILPRSISRRLSRSRTNRETQTHLYEIVKEVSITVKVKDILRWKSFRDLAEENEIAPPVEAAAAASPSRCTTTTTATATTASNSGRSSWCDSDFSAEDFPSWLGESDDLACENKTELKSRNCSPLKTAGSQITTGLKEELLHENEIEESHTPVSVLDFSFRENVESLHTSRRRAIKTIEPKSKFELQNRFFVEEEEANRNEERANELANQAMIMTCPIEGHDIDGVDYGLLLDFFRHELLITSRNSNVGDKFESEKVMRIAKAWLRGEDDGSLGWEMEGKREVCVDEMERRERWNKFEEEQEGMTVEIEITLLNSLLDELVTDLVSY